MINLKWNNNEIRDIMPDKYFRDDGTEIDTGTIIVPDLCLTCSKNELQESACFIARSDQQEDVDKGGTFCCFSYEPMDDTIDVKRLFTDMENYLQKKQG